VLDQLDTFGHLITLTVTGELAALQTLLATVRTARDIAHARDEETGAHLDRMSRYARLIALAIAERHGLTDEFVEKVFVFAPLHDIGKIGIPDRILLKPGVLSDEERAIMMTHARRGRELVDQMLGNFHLARAAHVDVLRNITELHHEAVDGSGYPRGLRAGEIPLEARIVAVADVFDALTSRRPYKPAWSNDRSFATLERLAGSKLDGDCVAALSAQRGPVGEIQRQFREGVV
jgi:HD-GYP domain-containing protein (c-di-GMP phosphodiesterase class II)